MENNTELFESIFNRNLWDTETQNYLENVTGEHPYFSPAQFFLLLQTDRDNPFYKKQVQKTAALFNNNYWLNYLLTVSSKPEQIFIQSAFENGETIADAKEEISANNNFVASEEMKIAGPETVLAAAPDEMVENEITHHSSAMEESNPEEEYLLNEPPPILEEASTNIDSDYDTSVNPALAPVNEELITEDIGVPNEAIRIEQETTTDENVSLINEDTVIEQAEISETTEEPTNSLDNEVIEENISQATPVNEESEQLVAAVENGINVEHTAPGNLTNGAHTGNDNEDKKRIDNTDIQPETMLFQPLYTSDYFASVGIKLSEEASSSDRLGKQLKSFTQWLKTMKKIDTHLSDPLLPAEIASENVDHNIKILAEKSNKDEEIITEAMADVLVQQGRINKAVEVLKKLSLLNPSKSTYFAAKIEQLKD